MTLEEKRQGNETLLRGVFLKERELKRAKERSKNISEDNMEKLLPILKKNQEKEIE